MVIQSRSNHLQSAPDLLSLMMLPNDLYTNLSEAKVVTWFTSAASLYVRLSCCALTQSPVSKWKKSMRLQHTPTVAVQVYCMRALWQWWTQSALSWWPFSLQIGICLSSWKWSHISTDSRCMRRVYKLLEVGTKHLKSILQLSASSTDVYMMSMSILFALNVFLYDLFLQDNFNY